MSGEVTIDEIEQLKQSLDRVDLVNLADLEAQLLEAQLPDHVLEHGDVEPALVTEVVIDHAGVGARALADSIDARAAVTVGRELADGGAEDLLSGSVCVPLSAGHRGQNTSQSPDWRKARGWGARVTGRFPLGAFNVNNCLLMDPATLGPLECLSMPLSSTARAPCRSLGLRTIVVTLDRGGHESRPDSLAPILRALGHEVIVSGYDLTELEPCLAPADVIIVEAREHLEIGRQAIERLRQRPELIAARILLGLEVARVVALNAEHGCGRLHPDSRHPGRARGAIVAAQGA